MRLTRLFATIAACLLALPPAVHAASLEQGRELLESNQPAAAYKAFMEVLEQRPPTPTLDLLLARAAYRAGENEAAFMACERLLMRQKHTVEARLLMGQSLYRLGSVRRGTALLEDLRDDPATPPATRAAITAFLATGGRK